MLACISVYYTVDEKISSRISFRVSLQKIQEAFVHYLYFSYFISEL